MCEEAKIILMDVLKVCNIRWAICYRYLSDKSELVAWEAILSKALTTVIGLGACTRLYCTGNLVEICYRYSMVPGVYGVD